MMAKIKELEAKEQTHRDEMATMRSDVTKLKADIKSIKDPKA